MLQRGKRIKPKSETSISIKDRKQEIRKDHGKASSLCKKIPYDLTLSQDENKEEQEQFGRKTWSRLIHQNLQYWYNWSVLYFFNYGIF